MCGILGVCGSVSETDRRWLKKSLKLLSHRGPDDEGSVSFDTCLLGHRRLSIIDLTPSGHQPMSNEDQSLWITYNGEIYNYIELKRELERETTFKSRSDTEVVIKAYEKYGHEAVNLFNGMWAFAVWDDRAKKLFASRDRFGEKPFYYYHGNGKLVFASEIKALLIHPDISKDINIPVLVDFLNNGLMPMHDQTFFREIRSLPLSHNMTYDAVTDTLSISRYWDIGERQDHNRSEEEWVEKLNCLLENSISKKLRSDVPIGSSLSGGLDSSTIVYMTSQLTDNTPHTFTASFRGEDIDESKYALLVSQCSRTQQHIVYPSVDGLVEDINKLVWHQEEPFGSTSIYAQWKVMELAKREGVKVLLDGQGADELFNGYLYFFFSLFACLLSRGKYRAYLNELTSFIKRRMDVRYILVGFKRLISPSNAKMLRAASPNRNTTSLNNKYDILWEDSYLATFISSLPPLLRYADKNSMAHSIEVRLPFLDHEIAELAFSIPTELKIKNSWTKYIMRRVIDNKLPDEITWRRDKVGYATPQGKWLRDRRFKALIESKLSSPATADFTDIPRVKKCYDKYLAGDQSLDSMIWRWINTEIWMEVFGLS